MDEKLYAVWNNEACRWARLEIPHELRIQYNHNGSKYTPLFASLEDIKRLLYHLGYDYNRLPPRFTILSGTKAYWEEHSKRLIHADKYL